MKNSLSSLSTKDLATLGQRTITISNESDYPVVKDNPLLAKLKTSYEGYYEVYTKKTFSGKGQLLVDADSHRDEPFAGMKFILLGYAKIKGSPLQQDAKDIYGIIENHGIDLDRYKWAEETAQIIKLLDEFEKPVNAAKIEHLQLTAVVSQIKEAQTAFEKLFEEVAGENSELRLMESASSFRKNLETDLRNYLNVVNAMNTLPGWKELYANLDEIVKAANNSRTTTPKTETSPAN